MSRCADTAQMREEAENGIRKWEEMRCKTTAEDGEREQQWLFWLLSHLCSAHAVILDTIIVIAFNI